MRYAFCLDFSGDALSAGFVSEDLETSGAGNIDLANFMAGDTPPMDKLMGLLLAKARSAPGDLAFTAVGLDCDPTPDRRGIVNSPNALWLENQPFADILEKTLGQPALLERRAALFLELDMALQGIPTDSTVIGCYINDAYESAIWSRGGIMAGKSGAAGNIGHMPVHGREDHCRCGKNGCIELYGTGYRLKQLHSLIFPDIPLSELFVKHSGHPLLQDFLHMMAYPIAVEANILDPDFIILGGSVPSMQEFPLEQVEAAIREQTYTPYPSSSFTLLPAVCKNSDGMIAAAKHGFEKIPKTPA